MSTSLSIVARLRRMLVSAFTVFLTQARETFFGVEPARAFSLPSDNSSIFVP